MGCSFQTSEETYLAPNHKHLVNLKIWRMFLKIIGLVIVVFAMIGGLYWWCQYGKKC